MDVSIIIPSYKGGDDFIEVLQRIFNQNTKFVYEVIVIDSGSSKDELLQLLNFPIILKQIPNKDFNHGGTRDFGASLAKGKYLIYMNQDTLPADNSW